VTLLSELDEPPALLARAREAAAKQADRQRALEDLDYAHDLAVGRGERGRLATTIGIAFTIAPLVLQSTVGPAFENHPVHIAWSGLFALIVLAWTWLGRSRLTTTLVNRRLLFTMIFMFFAQVLLMACMWRLGVSLAHSQVLMLFLYFVTAGLVTTTVDRTIAPTAVAYAIIFVVATFHIEYRYYLLSAGNAVFTINVLLSWRLQPG
jgi:hypothetical protein